MRRAVALLALIASPLPAQVFGDAHDALPLVGRDVAGGDLDGDGARDLVTVSSTTGTGATASLLPWLNDGAGNLHAGAAQTLMAGATAVSLADTNLDGRLDAVVSATGTTPLYLGGVSTLLGDGAGGFTTMLEKFVPGAPSSHALADVNGDGVLDVALALPATAQVAVLLGTGTGGFGAPTLLSAGPEPIAVALADLQLDGATDLVVLNGLGATVTVRLGAAGAFGAAVAYPTGAGADALLVARLDGDPFPDVLVANATDATLSLLRGDGAGGLLAQQVFATLPNPAALAASDIDLDGDLDVLVAEKFVFGLPTPAQAAAVHVNDGAGQLSAPSPLVTGLNAAGLDVADLDGDVLPDIALVTNTSLERRRGDGLGGFFDTPFFAAGKDPVGVALASLDGDRALDVAVANFGPDQTSVLVGDGAGGFSAPLTFPLGLDASPNDLVAVDVTGDGATDLVTSNVKTNDVSLLAGNGAGGFAAPVEVTCGKEPRALAAADLDGDGDPDVVTANTSSASVSVLRASGGTLLPGVATPVGGQHPTALALGHVDAGGTVDAVTANDFTNNYSLLRGDGAGGWLAPATFTGDGDTVRALLLADLDGDGDDDLVSAFDQASNNTGHLAVRLSNGAGGFAAPALTTIARSGADTVAADFDLDGALDVAVAHDGATSAGNNQVTLLLGNGTGGFASVQVHLANVPASSLAVGDLDADGAPDLVAAVGSQFRIAVLRNVSQGGPWHPLGSSLAGNFAPQLAGAGQLKTGTPGSLTLIGAPPLAAGALFFAPSSSPLPFKGGTLVPAPPAITSLLVVPASGLFKLSWSSFPPVGSGSTFYFQAAAKDVGAPAGVALSNAVEGIAP